MKKHGDFIRNRDYGGVHVLSGIPNRAFYLAAVAFGGYSWEKAGKIWWKVVSERAIPPNCTFIQFADATVDAAEALFGTEAAVIVRNAWNQVGVARKV
jgi:Zn-dependent metalloprotease